MTAELLHHYRISVVCWHRRMEITQVTLAKMELCRDNQASINGGNLFAYKTFFKGPCERRLDLLARNWHIKLLQSAQCSVFTTVQGWVPCKHLTRVLWIPAHHSSLWLFWWQGRSDETNWAFQPLPCLNLKHKMLWVLLCCTLINVIAPLKLAVHHAAKIPLINPLLVSLSDRKPPEDLNLLSFFSEIRDK